MSLQDNNIKLPAVAVIITNHNYGQWILTAITSAISQDYPNKKIYIYDDGSTDDSVEILNKLLQIDEKDSSRLYANIQGVDVYAYNCTENRLKEAKGPSYGRNRLIEAAINECHAFACLDADDYWLQGKLSESMIKIIEKPDKIGAVYTDTVGINVHTGHKYREFRESFSFSRLLEHNMVHSGCVISKAALQKVGVYDEEMRVAEDYDLWIRIAEHFQIYHIPKPLVVLRTGNYNSTATVSKEIWNKNWKRITTKMKDRHKNA